MMVIVRYTGFSCEQDSRITKIAQQFKARNVGSGYQFSARERDIDFIVPDAKGAAFQIAVRKLGCTTFVVR
jgi:hypothetical protein